MSTIAKNPQIVKHPSANKTYPGYCHSPSHKGYMVLGAICSHQCLEKNCPRFERLEHPIWTDRNYKTSIISYKKLKRIKDNYTDYSHQEEVNEEMEYQLTVTTYTNKSTGIDTAKLVFGAGNGFCPSSHDTYAIDIDTTGKKVLVSVNDKKSKGVVLDRFLGVTITGKKATFLAKWKGNFKARKIDDKHFEFNLKENINLFEPEEESPEELDITDEIEVCTEEPLEEGTIPIEEVIPVIPSNNVQETKGADNVLTEVSEKAIKDMAIKYVRDGKGDLAQNIAAAYKTVKERHDIVTEETINDTIFELLLEDDVTSSTQLGAALNLILGEFKVH